MNTTWILLRTHLIAEWNALRTNPRTQMTFVLNLILTGGIGIWGLYSLASTLPQWQVGGPAIVTEQLWRLYGLIWTGVCGLASMNAHTHGFAAERNRLLFTLPISPAARLRTLYGLVWLDGLCCWLLIVSLVLGVILTQTLGWSALVWVVLFGVGAGVAAWLGLIAVIGARVLLQRTRVARGDVASALGAALALPVAGCLGWVLEAEPTAVGLLLALMLLSILGPLAAPVGRLYSAAYIDAHRRTRQHAARSGLVTRMSKRILLPQRTLTSALLLRAILRRQRHWLNWLRLGMVPVALVIFPWIRGWLAPYAIPDALLVVGLSSTLVFLFIFDCATSPLGGEGNRLVILLTAPLTTRAILWVKLAVFLISSLAPGWLLSLALGWQANLSMGALAWALSAFTLMILGSAAFFTWGSTTDIDLKLIFSGGLLSVLYEEAPITPRRMLLVQLGMLLSGSQLLLLWHVPRMYALAVLFLLNLVVILTMWHFARHAMKQLVWGDGRN